MAIETAEEEAKSEERSLAKDLEKLKEATNGYKEPGFLDRMTELFFIFSAPISIWFVFFTSPSDVLRNAFLYGTLEVMAIVLSGLGGVITAAHPKVELPKEEKPAEGAEGSGGSAKKAA